jgi:hypothetical protein
MQPAGQPDPTRPGLSPAHPPGPAAPGPAAPAPRAASVPAAPAPAAPAAAAAAAPGRPAPAIRVSDADRDRIAQVLQAAFAEGRLDDDEFDERMRAALTARTSADLAKLTTDLPDGPPRPVPGRPAPGKSPGRFAIAYKNSIRRGGRWRVPERFTSVVYKGSGWLDLRAAELTAADTTVLAVAYKSRIDVLVPPGVRVELDGFGVSKGWSEQEELESLLPRDAPVVHVRGIAYKGTIEVSTRPPGTGELRRP